MKSPWQRGLDGSEKGVGFVFFDYGPRGTSLVLWLVCVLGFAGAAAVVGEFTWTLKLQWAGIALVVLAILGLDLMGSTLTYKSGLHEDRQLRITLDEQLYKGSAFRENVCPVGVFEVDRDRRLAMLPRAHACVQCGTCIVQCPFDALHFQHPDGGVIEPETIRRFKLNLIGKRLVRAKGGDAAEEKQS